MTAPAPTPQLHPTRARTTRACTAGPAVPTAPSAAAAVPRASPGRTARSVSVPCPLCCAPAVCGVCVGRGGAGGLGVPKAPRCPRRHRRLPVEPLPERRHLHRRGQLLRLPLPAQLRGQPLRERWGMSGAGQPPRPTPVGSIAGQIQPLPLWGPRSLSPCSGERLPAPRGAGGWPQSPVSPCPRRHGGLRAQLAQVPGPLLPLLRPPALLGGRGAGLPPPRRAPHQHPLAGGARLHQQYGVRGQGRGTGGDPQGRG